MGGGERSSAHKGDFLASKCYKLIKLVQAYLNEKAPSLTDFI